ncbi:hypothetical protein HMPREF9103_01446 [Lentilactobacillus parafarraginis F0439]|uniref:Uncharacterized protein n=1 Tax=Lentilactobacillus parafarraginis F0439 TaxID=797515 RepID=G9ZNZ2_9LACO|nr:hypothetical protein HMPREF9103_01446 [Lentilactobacillus parafarraginis F0439]
MRQKTWHNRGRGGAIVADTVTIDQLNDSATTKAMNDFIEFYLPRLRKNNLEILSMYKVDYYLADINHFIFENRSFTPEELRDEVRKECGEDLKHVISVINPDYYDNGNLVAGSWETWYEKKFEKVPVRD